MELLAKKEGWVSAQLLCLINSNILTRGGLTSRRYCEQKLKMYQRDIADTKTVNIVANIDRYFSLFIGPESDHWLLLSVTHSLTPV